jgi:hypothetical protein
MKKSTFLIITAVLLSLTACSKDKDDQTVKPEIEAHAEGKDKEATEPATKTKDEEAEETANLDEEQPAEETDSEDNSEGTQGDKEYLSKDHYFVASELVNMTEKEVSTKWGEPVRTEKIQFRYSGTSKFVPAVVHYYEEDEKYAVTFVDGKAARLVFTLDTDIPYEDEKLKALELAGLPTDVEETTETDTATVWNEIGDVYEVKSFSKGDLVDYLYIVLDEAYK